MIYDDSETIIWPNKNKKKIICDCCNYENDYRDLRQISYIIYQYTPEYKTPIERKCEVVCNECIDEYY